MTVSSVSALASTPISTNNTSADVVAANDAVNNLKPTTSPSNTFASPATTTPTDQTTNTSSEALSSPPPVYNALAAANSSTVRGAGVNILA